MANYRKSSRKTRGQKRSRTMRRKTAAVTRRSHSHSRSRSHPRRHLQSGG